MYYYAYIHHLSPFYTAFLHKLSIIFFTPTKLIIKIFPNVPVFLLYIKSKYYAVSSTLTAPCLSQVILISSISPSVPCRCVTTKTFILRYNSKTFSSVTKSKYHLIFYSVSINTGMPSS